MALLSCREVVCVLLISFVISTLGFNLEPKIPVVKQGSDGSYFGYSVAQHLSINKLNGTVQDTWILVGAPLDQNLQPETNHSGALWRCPVSTRTNDCKQVITDGKRNPDTGHYDHSVNNNGLFGPLSDEIKDGQWMGVTVKSQGPGRKVMVCAHRYVKKGRDYRWGQGLCYTLSQSLDYDETWEPCTGRPTNRAHEQWGYCQAGTSGVLLDDDTAVIGTPGPYTWRGTVFAVNISTNFLYRDKTYYYGPLETADEAPVDKYSYLGMAVTAGKYFGNEVSFVAGAPRANGTGQVVFFSKIRLKESKMEVDLVLSGEVFASSYGYELASADLNSDGLPDLIVGAPFYYAKDVGGAVYVYMNSPGGLTVNSPFLRITGKEESRFGFAISNIGDLNKDGYDDIAVGAPYEGKGSVYIYLGSKDGIIQEPSQVLKAVDLPGDAPSTFGYSLSGGMDLDGNGYPDLLTGAYEDDRVILIRSRPIIGITTNVKPKQNLQNIDPSSRGCRKDPNAETVCFSFQACFSIKSEEVLGTSLELKYRIEAETFEGQKKFSRVRFANGLSDKTNVVQKRIKLKQRNLKGCSEETVHVKKNTRDIQSPINFKMTYSLIQKEPRVVEEGEELPNINNYPILNQQEASKIFHATFEKDCGDDDICQSDLNVHAVLVDLPIGEKGKPILMLGDQNDVYLNVTVTNRRESAYEAKLFVFHPDSLSFVRSETETNVNPCQPYNQTVTICNLGNPFKTGSASYKMKFTPNKDIPQELKIQMMANTTSEDLHVQDDFVLDAVVVKMAEVSLRGSASPEQVFYGGEVMGESAYKYLDEIGPRINHTYEVYNKGPLKADLLEVHIDWPYEAENKAAKGKRLLYLTRFPTVEGNGECEMGRYQVNSLNLRPARPNMEPAPLTMSEDAVKKKGKKRRKRESSVVRRVKREEEWYINPEAVTDKDGKIRQVVSLHCDKGTAKCYRFVCKIRNLRAKQSAVIRIHSRLWNDSLVEDYPDLDWVRIASKASIVIPPQHGITQDVSNDVAVAETLAYPDLLDQQEAKGVPIWIIIVAVVAGLLLLVILILILWKVGFFKRKRPDPTLSGNLEKRKEANGDYIS